MADVAITGTVVDPLGQPYAYGRVQADFLPATGIIHTFGGNPIPNPSRSAGMDATGAFTISLTKNTDIVPTGSKWRITVTSADGSKNFYIDATITAAGSQTTALNAAAVSLGAAMSSGALPNGAQIFVGGLSTRDTVRAAVGLTPAIGSLYLSTAGVAYLKIANANATNDWEKITVTAAD